MKKEEFIDKMVKALADKGNKAKILNSVLIAMSIQESGWGTSEICREGKNYHGINWYDDEVCKKWKHFTHHTQQERNGKMVDSVEEFALCTGPGQSFSYIIQWFTKREKYKPIIGCKNYEEVCRFLTGKYATDSHYGDSLIAIIKNYNLTQYDPEDNIKCVHTVVKGDTIWGIARTYLGNGALYPTLIEFNGKKNGYVFIGEEIKIPK